MGIYVKLDYGYSIVSVARCLNFPRNLELSGKVVEARIHAFLEEFFLNIYYHKMHISKQFQPNVFS